MSHPTPQGESRSQLVKRLAEELRNGWVSLVIGEEAATELERLEDLVNILGRSALSENAPSENADRLDGADGCPCLVIGPCSYACTCVNPVMSGGCQRCAKYGSDEQRHAAATHIASALSASVPPGTPAAASSGLYDLALEDAAKAILGLKGARP